MLRLCAHRSIALLEVAWLSKIGAEFWMMSSTWLMLVLKSPTIAWVESTSRCSAGPSPPTDSAVSSSSWPILSFGSTVKPRLAVSSAGPISLGTVPLVIVWPGEKNPCALPSDTRSRYCSPTADTECTLADASSGILNWLSMLIVASAPFSVGSTAVTLPIVIPR